MQKQGTIAAVICTTVFEEMARRGARALGMAALPLVVIDHPLGGVTPEVVRLRAAQASDGLRQILGGREGGP